MVAPTAGEGDPYLFLEIHGNADASLLDSDDEEQ
jgi:hypothetical protein